ncbi:GvpT/GvpP family gas vesicle accessory protein [Bacillus sp. Marseille-Q3570]|uniref:GvpT/GvpP family gas vesicle accessory protein n=1 Tax=Bacillus sp. Marseille-Q3570 TaxID=2963522 RepID=UPI0021B7DAC3|nr:GvpT/GvpP family gas vesicle accessory protein [Bacillus sp. Marseille-Q3570]
MTDKQKNTLPTNTQQNSMNLAIIGGVVGASIGLLSSPGTGKKVVNSIGQSEVVKAAGNELRRTAQQMITEQAMMALRQTAAGYWSKYEGTLLKPGSALLNEGTEDEEVQESGSHSDERYNELKEENKNLNDQLQRIEEKLNALLDDKK